MVKLTPITERIGTEVHGIDVTQPISAHDFDRIYQAWIDTTILLIRGQSMTHAQQVAFTRKFGEVVSYTRQRFSEDEAPEVLILSNIQVDGKPIGSPVSGRVWHTDGHYLADPPAGSMLHAIETPPVGGDTLFANMFAAYEELPEATKRRIENRQVIISRIQSRPYNYPDRPPPTEQERAEWVDMPQPMVLTHPENGRKALYVGGNVPWRVVGMDESESAPLVTFVQEFSVMRRFTYRHKWRPGDIIIWDNRSAMHRATVYDLTAHRRRMHRTTFVQRSN
ncbi:TauD/TfdA dioxygenase family protein [Archangium lansingense]|uniref:TauD/TfdA family dioxygenase n=1 Tax=Archangium lansingense TaxID=2995310 RepID=A0ABT4ACN1_9BACT|nr:TauD/TfdA family dioxygenase [Archangium lansinium]MCY1079437.1 TauD/TfdA family dioxygenase [Archangium lansinium]